MHLGLENNTNPLPGSLSFYSLVVEERDSLSSTTREEMVGNGRDPGNEVGKRERSWERSWKTIKVVFTTDE